MLHTETLDFLQNYLNMNGISSVILNVSEDAVHFFPDYDHGLRRHFFAQEETERRLQMIIANIPENTVVYTKDEFRCHYVLLRLPDDVLPVTEHAEAGTDTSSELPAPEQILVIGPYLLEAYSDHTIQEIADKLRLPTAGVSYFRKYIHNLTITRRSTWFRNLLTLTASRLYNGDDHYKELFTNVQMEINTVYIKEKKVIPELRLLEERYAAMRSLLAAVREGSTDQALRHLLHFRSLSGRRRFENDVKEAQNWLIIFNTQLRMTAESAGVHPYDLDETSSFFSFRINAMTSGQGQSAMMQQMIRKYCELVNQQNLSGYSGVIQEVILRIRTGLQEELSLSLLASEMNLNASYLSSLFSREMGMKLTEYINRRRIEASLAYMNDPEISIKEILPEVGIYDLNYFTRLFRRYVGISPTEYRKRLSQKSE